MVPFEIFSSVKFAFIPFTFDLMKFFDTHRSRGTDTMSDINEILVMLIYATNFGLMTIGY